MYLPKISIVTVVYNGEKYLEQTILSVLNQSYSNIEYIIIDGGSMDNTINIIKKYQEKLAYWSSEKDQGISDAFNKGIKKCTGNIIGIISSDDWFEPEIFQTIANNYGKGGVIHGNLQAWKDNKKWNIFIPDSRFLKRDMTVNHHTMFVEKNIYEKYGFFRLDFKYAMDYELALRFYINGVQFYYIDKIISNARLDGISDRRWREAISEGYRAKKENGLSDFKYFIYHCFRMLRGNISNLMYRAGFNSLLDFYRKKFSLVKKVK